MKLSMKFRSELPGNKIEKKKLGCIYLIKENIKTH